MPLVESRHPLDLMLGMWYRVFETGPVAEIVEPVEKSFIVVEKYNVHVSNKPEKYCVYLLAKRGLSSIDASRLLARRLGVAWTSMLGLKDANATTLQAICMPCPKNPPPFITIPALLWARFIGYTGKCPGRRDSLGNCFTILLRVLDDSRLGEILEASKKTLLPAYYAYQRFGTHRPNTHLLGIRLLKADYKGFTSELLASDYPGESEETRICRRSMWSIESCTSSRLYEAHVSKRLRECANPLRSVGRQFVELFLSAVQAYIFNMYVSLRIRRGYDHTVKLSGERLAHNGTPLAYVPGIGYKPGVKGLAYEILGDALEYAGLDFSELANPPPGIPRIRPYWRPVYTQARDLDYRVYSGRAVLRFCMEKGMYATLLLREIIDVYKL